MEETNSSVLYVNLGVKEEGRTTPTGGCKAELSEASAVSMNDDFTNLIGLQDGADSADLQNVFVMVSYITG